MIPVWFLWFGQFTSFLSVNGSSSPVPTDTELETRQLLQSIAAVELYQAQIEVAKYLELAYHGVSDHPDVAKEVRLTAHSARTHHMMTVGLMKSFMVTAKHIISTMIPMIFDAVDLQDKDLVRDCFSQIITRAEEMKEEAMDTRQKYFDIQRMVQDNLAQVNVKNKYVTDEQRRIAIEKEQSEKLAEDAKRSEEELKKEKEKMEEELKQLESYRDKWMESTETARKELNEEKGKTFLDSAIVPPDVAAGPTGIVTGFLKLGVNLISSIFGRNKEEKKFRQIMQAYRDSQESVEKLSAEKREVLGKMQEQRKARLERLSNIKMLNSQRESLGDVRSLVEASARLGDVDRQILRIIQFWDNVAVTLKFLKDDIQAGEVYLEKLENPKYAERFKASIQRAEHGWNGFGKICGDYVFASENDEKVAIKVLYNFLSASLDDVPRHAREERMRAIESEIEENIKIDEEGDAE